MNKNKKQYNENLNEISTMLNKVRCIKEAISFDDDYDTIDEVLDEEDDFDMEEPMQEKPCINGECDIDKENDIDRIREIALKGMLKYVKQSNSAEYETLKKIFQFCDKVNNDKTEPTEEK